MKWRLFLMIMLFFISCYTPIGAINKHPNRWIGKEVKVRGYVKTWVRSAYSYYYITITDKKGKNYIVILKQIPNPKIGEPLVIKGRVYKFPYAPHNIIIADSTIYTYRYKKEKLTLKFRDTLPECHYSK